MTVVIPTRNRWNLLSNHGLRSAFSQEDVALEVIVVDDGSTDGTATRLADAHHPRLTVIRHERSRGQASARNSGIAAAHGQWLAFLDDDDLWSPRKLRTQLDTARMTGADFVYGGAVLLYEDGSILEASPLPDDEDLSWSLLESDVIPAGQSNILARTDLIRDLGGFDERLPYSADWELWIRLALAGRGARNDEILVAHFKHRSNDLLRHRPDVIGEFDRVLEKHARRVDATRAWRARRGLVEWLVHEYRGAGCSRLRAYLEVVRGQPSFPRAAWVVGHLLRERARRMASLAIGLLKQSAPPDSKRQPLAAVEPPWLLRYRSPRSL